jgi:hypothetical protein
MDRLPVQEQFVLKENQGYNDTTSLLNKKWKLNVHIVPTEFEVVDTVE